MKIAISSTGPDMDAPLDPRFGRAAYFIIVDEVTDAWQAQVNPAAGARGGAGVQAAQLVANEGVWAVVSGDYGPNAHQALTAAGLAMFLAPPGEALSVRQLMHLYRGGKLQQAAGPTQRDHYGMNKEPR